MQDDIACYGQGPGLTPSSPAQQGHFPSTAGHDNKIKHPRHLKPLQ